ncbi:hypothetical protein ASE16_02050 [Leifsonia sp. Root227]|nr:hypothetical protein ASE16_02050 [Leifsonia sp. Root227]
MNTGRAVARIARVDGELAGVSLGVMKPSGRFKISTLFVAPNARKRGVGSQLLIEMLDAGQNYGAVETYITGATTVRAHLVPLLCRAGFRLIATEPNRYGEGRDEDVFVRP